MSLLNLMVAYRHKRQKGYKCATKELSLYSYTLSGILGAVDIKQTIIQFCCCYTSLLLLYYQMARLLF